ncbi:MAG: hypothetical protein Q9216_004241 [Gyalolechia sp. 2 TL-2023]
MQRLKNRSNRVLTVPHSHARRISTFDRTLFTTLQPPLMPPPICLILDWDGTLTTTSTLPLIAQTGYNLNASSTRPRDLPSWNSISEAYMSDYRAHVDAYTPRASERNSIAQELAWLESLRDVESKSTERAEAGKIFCGVGKGDLQHAAEEAVQQGKVMLRSGWDRLIHRVVSENGEVGIVSVGWSAEFIRACLQAAVRNNLSGDGKIVENRIDIERMDVRANEIIGGQDGKMSRYFEENFRGGAGGIWTPRDKRKVLEDMIQERRRGTENLVVYVGDSTTDLDCLLSANVGICVRSEGTMTGEQLDLERTVARLGIDSRWIGQMNTCDIGLEQDANRTEMKRNSLWWARNFGEIWKSPLFNANNSIDVCTASNVAKKSTESEISSVYLNAPFKTRSHSRGMNP